MAAKSPARLPNSASPLSSPRLPSPPPLPELQLGPQSPSINATTAEIRLDTSAAQDEGAARRIRPGTSAAEMAKGPPFLPLHQLESPFQLQEYLKSSYVSATREESSNTVKPITRDTAMKLATPPIQQDTGEPVDRNLWLYELCRFLVHRTNRLIVSFFADNPPCSSQTCPEMRASEWQYLCAVHEPPKSCCAIDYCCHTLDWAANVLTSSRHFPSRLALGGEGGNAQLSIKQLTNIFRRVYRIYAHAWFQHREVFWSLEQEEGLYKFYKTVCDAYSLIPDDNYTVPPEAEGEREDLEETPVNQFPRDVQILRNETPVNVIPPPALPKETETPAAAAPTTGATTRRHKHTPSTGTQVTSIAEGAEDEEEHSENTQRQISQQTPADPTATSTNTIQSTSRSPPKHPRSPRPTSIPISAPQVDFHVPQDPTPTPERHNSDPFSENVSDVASVLTPLSSETSEPSTSDHVTEPKISSLPPKPTPFESNFLDTDKEPPTPLSAINTNQPLLTTDSTISPVTKTDAADDEEILRSPGGGSIRTVSNDFLSGILAHCDPSEENETKQTPVTQSSNTPVESQEKKEKEEREETKTVEKSVEAPKEEGKEPEVMMEKVQEAVKDNKEEEKEKKEAEKDSTKEHEQKNDEEMEEIKLDVASTSTTTATDTKSNSAETENEAGEKSIETREEAAKEDSTSASTSVETKETPAGVV